MCLVFCISWSSGKIGKRDVVHSYVVTGLWCLVARGPNAKWDAAKYSLLQYCSRHVTSIRYKFV